VEPPPIPRYFALWAAGFGLLLPVLLVGISTFDEGHTATLPMLLLDGKLPIRDFFTRYGPGQFYLHAALFGLLGEQLWVVRLTHVATLAGLGVAIYALAERFAGGGWKAASCLWLAFLWLVLFVQPVIAYAAHLAVLFLLCSVLVLRAEDDERAGRSLAVASVLVGLAGLFRWDVGGFGLAALLVAALFTGGGSRTRRLLAAAAPCGLFWLVVYVPLVIASGVPRRWLDEVLLFSLFEFEKWRGTELVGPALGALGEAFRQQGAAALLSRPFLTVLLVFAPPLVVLASLGVLAARAPRAGERWRLDRRSLRVLYLALLALLLLNQMRVRPTLWQGFPATCAALPLIAFLFCSLPAAGRLRLATRGAFLAAALLASAGLVVGGASVVRASQQGRTVASLERARGIRLRPQQAPYAELVDFVRRSTRPGEAIYSGVVDHQRLTVNDVMIYFLADRPPADRFVVLEPGIANARASQRETILALEAQHVRLLVLLESRSTEPNLSSVPSGASELDDYIRTHYRVVQRIGGYRILARRDRNARPPPPP
jgi:hypothetical protein